MRKIIVASFVMFFLSLSVYGQGTCINMPSQNRSGKDKVKTLFIPKQSKISKWFDVRWASFIRDEPSSSIKKDKKNKKFGCMWNFYASTLGKSRKMNS